MEWKDATSYRYGQEHAPTAWSTKAGGLRISIVSNHIYYPGRWVIHCSPFFDTYELVGVETAEEAQAKAIELVKNEIAAVVMAFQEEDEDESHRL